MESSRAISTAQNGKFVFASSVEADVWHRKKDPKAYEWWYFDALSDDGREAIIIVFLDNFIYSPRYNRENSDNVGLDLDSRPHERFPAIAVTYYRDGKPLYRAVNEYSNNEFGASEYVPECRIGDSSFRMETASYGSGYLISLDIPLSRNRRLKADLEWLSIESNFRPGSFCIENDRHFWNLVTPRSDVTGKLAVSGPTGKQSSSFTFRGTGYHDHNLDNRWLARTISNWHWGRGHFADCTAVFCRYCEVGDEDPSAKLILVRDGGLHEMEVQYDEQNYVRDKFGIRYPNSLRLVAEDKTKLTVKPLRVIDSSFFYLRFLNEIVLIQKTGEINRTTGISEFFAPAALRHRWLNWLSDIRTGKNGKGPLVQ